MSDTANHSQDALRERIIATLKSIFDPEIPVNIYELGLIYNVDVNPSGAVAVRMTLTSPACPAAGSLPPEVRQALARDMVDHRGPEFIEAFLEVTCSLNELFRTDNEILMLTGSGTGGLEASVANLFSAGEKVLLVSIGYFGDRYDKIARAFGVETV